MRVTKGPVYRQGVLTSYGDFLLGELRGWLITYGLSCLLVSLERRCGHAGLCYLGMI